MASKTATLNGKSGVWRTVGGRKIFIANGQSLGDAMRASGKFKNLKGDFKRGSKEHYDAMVKGGMSKEDAKHIVDIENGKKVLKEDSYGGYHSEKTIQMKGGDKTKYEVLDEATDSIGEKIYKVKENGQEKWVQGDLFDEIGPSKLKLTDDNVDKIVNDYVKSGKSQDELRSALYGADSEVSAGKTVSALQDFYIQKQDQYTRMYENGEISYTALEAAGRFNYDDTKFNLYKESMSKDGISIKGKVYNQGDRVQMEDPYTHNYFGDYTITREATRSEKLGKMNADMKGYIITDTKGNQSLVSEMRIKTKADAKPLNTVADYKQYYRELGYSDNVAAAMANEIVNSRVTK